MNAFKAFARAGSQPNTQCTAASGPQKHAGAIRKLRITRCGNPDAHFRVDIVRPRPRSGCTSNIPLLIASLLHERKLTVTEFGPNGFPPQPRSRRCQGYASPPDGDLSGSGSAAIWRQPAEAPRGAFIMLVLIITVVGVLVTIVALKYGRETLQVNREMLRLMKEDHEK